MLNQVTYARQGYNDSADAVNYLEPLLVDNARNMLLFKRWTNDGSQVAVGLNSAPRATVRRHHPPAQGRWHEWVFNYGEDLGDTLARTIELPGPRGEVWVTT